VHQPDGDSYPAESRRTEDPGNYFHPLIATLVAGSGRLQLALVMRLVTDSSGQWVYCDTDSLYIAATRTGGLYPCPGGTELAPNGTPAIRLLSWDQVDAIVEQLAKLNPYRGELAGKSLLKVEDENFDPDSGQQWPITCWAIAAKRSALFRPDRQGQPVIVGPPDKRKRSEHGLGHLIHPSTLVSVTPGSTRSGPTFCVSNWDCPAPNHPGSHCQRSGGSPSTTVAAKPTSTSSTKAVHTRPRRSAQRQADAMDQDPVGRPDQPKQGARADSYQ
jgi:hypothetical protein